MVNDTQTRQVVVTMQEVVASIDEHSPEGVAEFWD